ncbi:hypothetical protein V5799_005744 [Amblyomma americanum]|uniref:Uncharacterized protein n=1 Tax=Amblyomma americanum TaxID=6943 RepID=A0AAQ4DYD3_AMBAM
MRLSRALQWKEQLTPVFEFLKGQCFQKVNFSLQTIKEIQSKSYISKSKPFPRVHACVTYASLRSFSFQ